MKERLQQLMLKLEGANKVPNSPQYHVKRRHKAIALTLLLTILQPLIPYNTILANNNGPNAPEAASFEPVDATDMVNLLTGGFTYVLPLMNVPSPEGGYPIALAYHAGIAMDQEASWTGLGWNLNPGAINRSVNGYPDDYSSSTISDYLYDEGEEIRSYSLSLGYSLGVSVGVGISWGSHQSLGGHVSAGFGISDSVGVNATVGPNGASVGVTVGLTDALSVGLRLSTDGNVGITANFNSNGTGFGIGASTDGTYSASFTKDAKGFSNTISLSLSSQGVGLSLSTRSQRTIGKGDKAKTYSTSGSIGIGTNTSFSRTISEGDYTKQHSAYTIPIMVPTPIGIFSLTFGSQRINYFSANKTENLVTGPLNFYKKNKNGVAYAIKCDRLTSCGTARCPYITYDSIVFTKEEKDQVVSRYDNCDDCSCEVEPKPIDLFMDIYEIPLTDNANFSEKYNIKDNNPSFPAYDSYNVQAQGLSGSIHSKILENGSLFGLPGIETDDDVSINYVFNGSNSIFPNHIKFSKRPVFQFDNEITSYLKVGKANFQSVDNIINQSNISNAFRSFESSSGNATRPKTANHIQYATNKELLEDGILRANYLKTKSSGFDRADAPADGIGAYKITTPDGKTYHYSLPVYNHETIIRTYGMSPFHPGEGEHKAYQEKRQLVPYATHWLLTAVTGPDYIDDGDGIAGDGDLGYWVNFDYGLWDDAYVWKAPYGKSFLSDPNQPEVKKWIRGRKQQYFLDKIKTRTHAAIFIKNYREDNRSPYWSYKSVVHQHNQEQDGYDYKERFEIPEHKTLRLDKIILVKNEDDVSRKNFENKKSDKIVTVSYPNSNKLSVEARYELKENIFDWSDNWQQLKNKAIKVVCFDYVKDGSDGALVQGSPNTGNSSEGRLTLKSVRFGGKQDATIIPPYRFNYSHSSTPYSRGETGLWGYHLSRPSAWSLNKIITPEGGSIAIEYGSNRYKTVTPHKVKLKAVFSSSDPNSYSPFPEEIHYTKHADRYVKQILSEDLLLFRAPETGTNMGFAYGNKIHLKWNFNSALGAGKYGRKGNFTYDGLASYRGNVSRIENGETRYYLKFRVDNPENITRSTSVGEFAYSDDFYNGTIEADSGSTFSGQVFGEGGVRVDKITTSDGINDYTMEYKYGKEEDGVGTVSYLPFSSGLQEEIPYSTELPSPRPMYEYVSVLSNKLNAPGVLNRSKNNKTVYHFNVLKRKNYDEIVYDNFYRLDTQSLEYSNDDNTKKVKVSTIKIEDNLSSLGQLLSVSVFNWKGQLLNKITNNYFKPEELENNIGVFQESYQSYKESIFKLKHPIYNIVFEEIKTWHINSSTRIKYPNLLKSSTVYSNGVTYTSKFSNFDPISGQSKQTHSFSSTGLELKSISEPAFRKYSEMGSKSTDINNKNMLSQAASTYSYFRRNSTDDWKLYDAEVETWKSQEYDVKKIKLEISTSPNSSGIPIVTPVTYNAKENIWRKHKNYVWKGPLNKDGSFNFNPSTDSFDWNKENLNEAQAPSWQKVLEITKYSDYSRPLETKDINGNKASSKLQENESKLMVVCNAGYNEMFYSGAESRTNNPFEFDGGVRATGVDASGDDGVGIGWNSVKAHTGKHSVRVGNTLNSFEVTMKANEHRAGNYKISVWIDKGNENLVRVFNNGTLKEFNGERIEAGDWIMLNHYEPITANQHTIGIRSVSSSQTIYADDFRIHPIASTMTSYVYNEWDELTFIIGPNNLATCYAYDEGGRLTHTYVEVVKNNSTQGGFKLINETRINYKNQ